MTAGDARYDLPFRSGDDTSGEVGRVVAKLEASGNLNDIMRLLANSELGFRPFVHMSNAFLTRSELPATVREAAILAMAARQQVAYEWKEHLVWAERVGLSSDQCAAIEAGRIDDESLFAEDQRLAMRVATDIVRGRALDEATWEQMCDAWGKEQALDLLFVVAWWGGFVPTMIRSLGVHGLG